MDKLSDKAALLLLEAKAESLSDKIEKLFHCFYTGRLLT